MVCLIISYQLLKPNEVIEDECEKCIGSRAISVENGAFSHTLGPSLKEPSIVFRYSTF
jgi:hypothetical protein